MALVLIAAVAAVGVRLATPERTAVDLFWQPLASSTKPAILWTSAGQFQLLPPRILHELGKAEDAPINVRLEKRELQFIESQVSTGNMHSIISICSLLQRMGRPPP